MEDLSRLGISQAQQASVEAQVRAMAALIGLMGTSWVILAILFTFHFRKPPMGEHIRLQESRPPGDLKGDVDCIESIELDDFAIFRIREPS